MGAKTWMLVYANGRVEEALQGSPQLDGNATLQLANTLFPKDRLQPIGNGSLSYTCPTNDEVHIDCFPGVSVLAAEEFGIDYRAKLSAPIISAADGRTVYLHAMHSVVDWLAYAQWVDGRLVRSLSVSPMAEYWRILGSVFHLRTHFGLKAPSYRRRRRRVSSSIPPP